MNKQPFTYDELDSCFRLFRRGEYIADFSNIEATPHFMNWLVKVMNDNYEKFAKERSEKLIKELGF